MLIINDPSPLLKPFMDHDPRDPYVLSREPEPETPESLVRAIQDQRKARADWLVDLWQRDRTGFTLFAGEFIWEDPAISELLPYDAAMHAVTLVNEAAMRLYRQKHPELKA